MRFGLERLVSDDFESLWREGLASLAVFHTPFAQRAAEITVDLEVTPHPGDGNAAIGAGGGRPVVPQVDVPADLTSKRIQFWESAHNRHALGHFSGSSVTHG